MREKKVNSGDVRKLEDGAKDPMIGFEPLLTIAEAAHVLGVKEPTLYGWIQEGKFEGLKLLKKSVRVRPEAVREFLQAAQKKAQARVA